MMLKRWFTFGGLLTATALALLLVPATSAAAPRGGGGRSYGGRSYGSYGGYSGYGNGGYNRGYGYGGYNRGYGYGGYNRGYGFYPGYYGTYGSGDYGYTRNYGYFSTYPDYSGYYVDEGSESPSYSSTGPATTYQSFYPSTPSTAVTMNVHVPDANADVWIENSPTQQRGMDREFVSPALDTGRTFTYHVRARWMENGQERDQTRNVDVQAGQRVTVDFTQSPPTEVLPKSPKPLP